MSRRKFITNTFLGSIATSSIGFNLNDSNLKKFNVPRIISTWNHGLDANKVAWKNLKMEKEVLPVEQGVRVSEDDPNERSVGLGGFQIEKEMSL